MIKCYTCWKDRTKKSIKQISRMYIVMFVYVCRYFVIVCVYVIVNCLCEIVNVCTLCVSVCVHARLMSSTYVCVCVIYTTK